MLPLVGMGGVFDAAEQAGWLTKIGPKASLPSGGFSNQSLRGLLADLGPDSPAELESVAAGAPAGLSAGQPMLAWAICCRC